MEVLGLSAAQYCLCRHQCHSFSLKGFFSFPFRRLDYPLLTLPSTFKRALLAIETPGKFPAALRKNRIKTPASKGYSSKWVCKIGERRAARAPILSTSLLDLCVSLCTAREKKHICLYVAMPSRTKKIEIRYISGKAHAIT